MATSDYLPSLDVALSLSLFVTLVRALVAHEHRAAVALHAAKGFSDGADVILTVRNRDIFACSRDIGVEPRRASAEDVSTNTTPTVRPRSPDAAISTCHSFEPIGAAFIAMSSASGILATACSPTFETNSENRFDLVSTSSFNERWRYYLA